MAQTHSLSKIGIDELLQHGFINKKDKVKILAKGELKSKLDVEANAFSKAAEEAITALGGTVVIK